MLGTNWPTRPCEIVPVGKRRDGRIRFWCLSHKANATAKYGVADQSCAAASLQPVSEAEILWLDIDKYPGGVALWGAANPIYDTTAVPMERGIHVHTREKANGEKGIDQTFRAVTLVGSGMGGDGFTVSESEAIYYMVASVFGFEPSLVTCGYCGRPHLDRDFFSVHPHRRHLCVWCGRYFLNAHAGIGNPIAGVRAACKVQTSSPRPAGRTLQLSQSDFPGGIQIWGSNPAFVWTAETFEEEGVHVHAFADGTRPLIDETFSEVIIDGEVLEPIAVRILMAQMSLPSLVGRVVPLRCKTCGPVRLHLGSEAFNPTALHTCDSCGRAIASPNRRRKVVSNPLLSTLEGLSRTAVRRPQAYSAHWTLETL